MIWWWRVGRAEKVWLLNILDLLTSFLTWICSKAECPDAHMIEFHACSSALAYDMRIEYINFALACDRFGVGKAYLDPQQYCLEGSKQSERREGDHFYKALFEAQSGVGMAKPLILCMTGSCKGLCMLHVANTLQWQVVWLTQNQLQSSQMARSWSWWKSNWLYFTVALLLPPDVFQ